MIAWLYGFDQRGRPNPFKLTESISSNSGPWRNNRRLIEVTDPEPGDARSEQHTSDDERNYSDGDPKISFLWRRLDIRRQCRIGCVLFAISDYESRRRRKLSEIGLNQQTVAFARHGLDVNRLFAGIAESLAKLIDGGIDVGVVIDVRLVGPEAQTQLFARQDVALFLYQCEQHLVDLALQAKARTAFGHFLALLVNLKRAEPDITRRELDRPGRSCGRIGFHRRTQVRKRHTPHP
jgi:hypothetical protein